MKDRLLVIISSPGIGPSVEKREYMTNSRTSPAIFILQHYI